MLKRIWLMAMIVFDILDVATSYAVVTTRDDIYELNFLVSYFWHHFGPVVAFLVIGSLLKIIALILSWFFLNYLEIKNPRFFSWILIMAYFALALRITVVAHHLYMLSG